MALNTFKRNYLTPVHFKESESSKDDKRRLFWFLSPSICELMPQLLDRNMHYAVPYRFHCHQKLMTNSDFAFLAHLSHRAYFKTADAR